MSSSKWPDLNTLCLEQQVAQMVVRASGYLLNDQIQYPVWEPKAAQLQHWVQNLGVGGSAGELAVRSPQLQNCSKIAQAIAADIEEGVGQRFWGETWFPLPMILSAIALKNLAKVQE